MIKAWSPSKLEKYEQCPLRCKLETEDKLCPKCFKGRLTGGYDRPAKCGLCGHVVEQAEPLVRGSRLHKMLEVYVQGPLGEPIPEEISLVGKWAQQFRAAFAEKRALVELSLAFDQNWKVVDWFSKDAWLRAKLDLVHFRKAKEWDVIDWKTGKLREGGAYGDQLNVYATAVMSAYPQPTKVTAALVFVDAGKSVSDPEGTVKRRDLKALQDKWTKRVKSLLTDEIFPPNPGNHCRWCDYSKSRGGPCRF